MAFDKDHEKLGGRKKGTRNKGTDSIKILLNTLLPELELAALWKQKLYSKDPHVALEARVFKQSELVAYCVAKHVQHDDWLDKKLEAAQPSPDGLRTVWF
jgi:hypothetical protein